MHNATSSCGPLLYYPSCLISLKCGSENIVTLHSFVSCMVIISLNQFCTFFFFVSDYLGVPMRDIGASHCSYSAAYLILKSFSFDCGLSCFLLTSGVSTPVHITSCHLFSSFVYWKLKMVFEIPPCVYPSLLNLLLVSRVLSSDPLIPGVSLGTVAVPGCTLPVYGLMHTIPTWILRGSFRY